MANDRAHKQGTEALYRLKSDHDQFLEAYEKPTQIYRFLQARHALKPLFLHRNLTYMQHRKTHRHGKKRLRRLQVNDLIKHTREPTKPDLASEIKSDNCLQISFHGLESGLNFEELLESTAKKPACHGNSSDSHESQMVEVEVLLYKFRRPVAETVMTDPNSQPCTCSSLGKKVLHYHPSPDSNTKQKKNKPVTLSIPESELTWKNNAGSVTSTQILVFKAKQTYVKKVDGKKMSHGSLESRNSCRKNVAISLNRLNQADIVKAKQDAVRSQEQAQQPTQQTTSTSTMASFLETNISLLSATANTGRMNGMVSKELKNNLHQVKVSKNLAASSNSTSHSATSNSVDALHTSSLNMVQRRPKVKIVKEKKDAAVMTDLVFGTENVSHVYQGQKSTTGTVNNKENRTTSSQAISSKSFASVISPTNPRDKCTSPISKFPDGIQNGFSNSLSSSPEDMIMQSGAKEVLMQPKTSISNSGKNKMDLQLTCESREEVVCLGDGSNGKRGGSFKISIPRTFYSSPQDSGVSEVMSEVESISVSPLGRDGESQTRKNSVYKRRSEIQLLYDGDKPPGQGINPEDIPMFTAEDLSNRSSKNSVSSPSRPSWHGSSTRKVTPPEHFAYPILSPKRTSANSSLSSPTCTMLNSDGNRKRLLNESERLEDSALSPPLAKQLKLSDSAESIGVPEVLENGSSMMLDKQSHLQASFPPMRVDEIPGVSSSVDHLHAVSSIDLNPTATALISPDDVYSAELVAYDSRGICLLQDGEYCMLMQRCSSRENGNAVDLLSFGPLTWKSVFGGGDSKSLVNEEAHNIMLNFSVKWSEGPPKHRLVSEFDTALDLKKIREAYFPPRSPTPPPSPLPQPPLLPPPPPPLPEPEPEPEPEPAPQQLSSPQTISSDEDDILDFKQVPNYLEFPNSGTQSPLEEGMEFMPSSQLMLPSSSQNKVFFNFLYNNNTVQQTECREDMACPWCFLHCKKIYALLKHMSLCHPRFHFTYTPLYNGGRGDLIEVHVNKLYDTQSTVVIGRDPGERSSMNLLQRRKGPVKCLPCTALIAERHVEVEEDLSEFLNDGSWKRALNTNRIYFHSQSCMPMLAGEINTDSEGDEKGEDWTKVCSQKMIDEFTDVNKGEKELMKLWNLFSIENRLIADKQIPSACVQFASEKRDLLIEKGMVQNFMTHLICLCDFGLITPPILRNSMTAIYGPP